MSNNRNATYAGTPKVTVVDNRSPSIRIMEYNRLSDADPPEEYITRNRYTLSGQLESSIDPRLFLQSQSDDTVLPNIRNIASLGGDVLCTDSVDAGKTLRITDAEGRQV